MAVLKRDYAKAIVDLIDDADNRARMGKLGRARVEEELAWPHSARAYLGVYERVAGPATAEPVTKTIGKA